jgi:hypothetical protein
VVHVFVPATTQFTSQPFVAEGYLKGVVGAAAPPFGRGDQRAGEGIRVRKNKAIFPVGIRLAGAKSSEKGIRPPVPDIVPPVPRLPSGLRGRGDSRQRDRGVDLGI